MRNLSDSALAFLEFKMNETIVDSDTTQAQREDAKEILSEIKTEREHRNKKRLVA